MPESTQRHVPIYEIKDDVVIMRDGTLRAVLLTSSLNFMLKSEEEQTASIQAYVSFLNSFQFPVQIVVQSRRLNIDPYIAQLQEIEREQTNELLRQQTMTYRSYIEQLVELGNIMTKRFYVVVPYNPLSDKPKSFWERLGEAFRASQFLKLSEKRFQQRKKDLLSRVDIVATGLTSMNLRPVMLNTQNLIELYRDSYNIGISERQHLVDLNKLQIEKDAIS